MKFWTALLSTFNQPASLLQDFKAGALFGLAAMFYHVLLFRHATPTGSYHLFVKQILSYTLNYLCQIFVKKNTMEKLCIQELNK